MLKKSLLLLFSCIFTFLFNLNTYAYENELIRIGLEYKHKNVSSIPISNNEITVGFEVNSKFYSCGNINISNAYNAKLSSPYYLEINQYFSNYESALSYSNFTKISDYQLIPALTDDNRWKVYVGGFNSKTEAEKAKQSISSSNIVQTGSFAVSLYGNSKEILVFNSNTRNLQVKEPKGISTTLNDRSYRGVIEIYRASSLLTAINVLNTDEYLFSVVPSEMPPQWNKEALKAQAVACRNYSISRRGVHTNNAYDLCDSTHCQAYKGSSNESQSSSNAVTETSGLMIYYKNEIINAVYHSSSGGYTENSENVWNYSMDYLKGVAEVNEPTAKMWTRSFTLAEITDLLNKNNINIGSAIKVYIGSISSSNRVNQLIIEGTNGKKILEKEDIRTFFSSSNGGVLESRNFSILGSNSPINLTVCVMSAYNTATADIRDMSAINVNGENINYKNNFLNMVTAIGSSASQTFMLNGNVQNGNNNSTGNIVFSGKGWGHGVGMSQHGANGMAEIGYTFEQILKHYYKDVEIK